MFDSLIPLIPWIGSLALALAGGGGWVAWLRERRLKPIEAKKSEDDHAMTAVHALEKALASLSTRLASTEARLDAEESRAAKGEALADAQSRRIDLLEYKYGELVSWAEDIHDRWFWWREQPKPPPLPHSSRASLNTEDYIG